MANRICVPGAANIGRRKGLRLPPNSGTVGIPAASMNATTASVST